MTHKLAQVEKGLHDLNNGSHMETLPLFPGVHLAFLTLRSERLSLGHEPFRDVMEINYCRNGRMGWKMGNGNSVYLGPGDYALHTMDSCARSVMTLPNGFYEGLTLLVELRELAAHPPALLSGVSGLGELLYEKFCKDKAFSSFAVSPDTEAIFRQFYGQPKALRLPYCRLKTLVLLLYLAKLTPQSGECLSEYQAEQIELVRRVHDQLTADLSQRITIEALSRQYHLNPTTLKATFKAVYGNSIAAHIREHRMALALKLLKETDLSIAAVARAVGYETQSKFTAAFKACYQTLPTHYRKGC